jgi:hypothetical protein
MSDESAERVARNNATFRAANEEIRFSAETHRPMESEIPFLCECQRPECTEIVRMSLEAYTEIRSHPRHFLTACGHEGADGSNVRIVEQSPDYAVVEKVGEAGQLVEDLDRAVES